ncbi:LysR family transcriptional regulator [Enterococcus alishanensis]|uniref:LysR family transcriptional regulator n=1 Tax=Enterococcus alishanensis TaxID=1303817 RepID=A0ABS6TCY7_9ENTE|nr:LysR family transcriptional regulator [Enterococcus alishanensis]MBV7390746.1 LysR family transcriptional regulator [Enterococcus alishanensis]
MDFQKLQLFVDLAETLNYSDTAAENFTTQSNVSKKITALEKELDSQLFERKHHVHLTEAGELILPFAQQILRDYQGLQQQLITFKQQQDLSLIIHAIPTMPNYQAFASLTTFLVKNPQIQLQLHEAEADDLALPAANNSLSFLRSLTLIEGNEYLLTEQDRLVVVLPAKHPLAQEKSIQLGQLKNENFLFLGNHKEIYYSVIELCQQNGFTPKIGYQGTRIELILSMVNQGIGVALVMEKTTQTKQSNEIKTIPIAPEQNSYLYFEKGPEGNEAVQKFWQFLKKEYSNLE